MKKFEKLLKGHKYILFMDFEGTQFSHEMIAVGAVLAKLKKDGTAVACKKPYKALVRAKNKIGKYVTELTGITEEDLRNNGITFAETLTQMKKYCGLVFSKTSFCTFGNHDMRILSQSFMYNFDAPKEITSQIQKNYIDFTTFMNEFLRDDKGNPLSLKHAIEAFGMEEEGDAHDPEWDAVNLMNLYNAFITHPVFVQDQYKHNISRVNRLNEPIQYVINKLANGEDVTAEEFDEQIKKYLS